MADFESIIKGYCSEDGNIPSDAIAKLTKAISSTVGNEFVEKTRYKAKLEEIDTLKAEKQTAEDSATTAEKWKTKHDALKAEFDTYKTDVEAREPRAANAPAHRALHHAAVVGSKLSGELSEKRIEAVLKASDIDSIELENGKIKNADKLTEQIKADWPDFIVGEIEKGADTPKPPTSGANTFEAMSLADKMAFANANPEAEEVKSWLKR